MSDRLDRLLDAVSDLWRSTLGAPEADTPTGIACPSCGERDLWTYGLTGDVFRCHSCRWEALHTGANVFRASTAPASTRERIRRWLRRRRSA